jgi:cell division protein FtsW
MRRGELTWRPAQLLAWVAAALLATGIVTLASASTVRAEALTGDPLYFLKRQLCWLAVGLAAAVGAACWDHRWWRRLAWPAAGAATLMLALVLVFGRRVGGSHRWLFGFQPSELAKFTTLLLLAAWVARNPLKMGRFREGVLIPGVGLGVILGLILLEPDFGTTALLALVGWLVMLASGSPKRWLIPAAVVGAALLVLYLRLSPHRWERILAWLYPERYPRLAHQYTQAKMAFMMGGTTIHLFGGIQKHYYLPEVHTDFIFAILGEEAGLAGTLGVAALFFGFGALGLTIGARATTPFASTLAYGMTMLISLQAILNMYVCTGTLPTKGLALPFFSYGGSNLVMTLLQCGILLNIGRHDGPVTARAAGSGRRNP